MKIRYAEPLLPELDRERADCLVLTAFTDDRPLRGLAGRVDWRLNGRLSRLMCDEFIDGHLHETMLTPVGKRLPFKRLLFVGMGERAQFNEQRFASVCEMIFVSLARLHIVDFAMALPGRIGLDVGLRQALRGWEDGVVSAFPAEMIAQLNICLVESGDVQRELLEPMRRIGLQLANQAHQALEEARVQEQPETPAPKSSADLRRRDWSTGMVRIVETEPELDLDEDEEIAVADVPESKRRSGVFSIPKAPPGAFDGGRRTRPTPVEATSAAWAAHNVTPNPEGGANRPLGPSLPRRPSGQWAAVRRSSLQYDIPTQNRPTDFNAPPVSPPSEPVDRSRRSGGFPVVDEGRES